MDCPNCDYDLTGLLAIHVCPECGFAYDPHSAVIVLKVCQRHISNVNYAVLLLLGAWYYGHNFRGVLLFAVLIAWYVIRFVWRARSSGKLSINKKGIRLEHPDVGEFFCTWSDITRAKYHWLLGRLRLYDSKGKRITDWPSAVFGGQLKSNRCAKLINRLAHEYGRYER